MKQNYFYEHGKKYNCRKNGKPYFRKTATIDLTYCLDSKGKSIEFAQVSSDAVSDGLYDYVVVWTED